MFMVPLCMGLVMSPMLCRTFGRVFLPQKSMTV
jgi:hypothetical protein